MKKMLLAPCLIAAMGVSGAHAYTLIINGNVIEEVTSASFSGNADSLTITTTPNNLNIDVVTDGGTGGGGTGGADTTAPTLTITSDKTTLTTGQTATLSFDFSEAVTLFDATDVLVTGGTLSGFAATGGSPEYTATLTPTGAAAISISVASGSYEDPAGNAGIAASLNLTYSEAGADPCNPAPAGVTCGSPITNFAATGDRQRMQIPRGQTLASKFTTTSGTGFAGTFDFTVPTGQATPGTNIWVSSTPGGAAISNACLRENKSFVYNLTWTQTNYEPRYCYLPPNTTLYLNLKHVDPLQATSWIDRFLSNNGKSN